MMEPAIKEKWVAALRSGKYEQGKGCMHDEGKYCCLGVLYEVAEEQTPPGRSFPRSNDGQKLPYLGLTPCDQADLAMFNDEEEWDFNQIADYIEKSF